MSDRLPTVYYGIPDDEKETRAIDDALNDIVTTLNSVPGHLSLRLICSVVVTVCCNQDDPGAAFQIIGANVASAIKIAIAEPKGSS